MRQSIMNVKNKRKEIEEWLSKRICHHVDENDMRLERKGRFVQTNPQLDIPKKIYEKLLIF